MSWVWDVGKKLAEGKTWLSGQSTIEQASLLIFYEYFTKGDWEREAWVVQWEGQVQIWDDTLLTGDDNYGTWDIESMDIFVSTKLQRALQRSALQWTREGVKTDSSFKFLGQTMNKY